MNYNLKHLVQESDQEVLGPIQDDEALLLYAIIRTMRIHNIVEIGGLNGYSAKNFSEALIDGKIYTVDINPVFKVADNHIIIEKNCKDIIKSDIPDSIDMVFFDELIMKSLAIFLEIPYSSSSISQSVPGCIFLQGLYKSNFF
jgi:predicted O-methyltransferase YrrM